MEKKKWSLGDKLTAGGLFLAVVAIIVGLLTPEVRQFFHLEKPPEVAPTTTSQTNPQLTPQTQNSEPPKQELPKPTKKTTQKTTTRITGNESVAGNIVEGSNNVLGNNNTVNNYTAPPPRRLSDEQKRILVPCLQMKTGAFTVSAIMNNAEAHRYAQDFSEVFTAGGWKNEQQPPVQAIWITGGWTGVHFKFAGTWDEAAKRAVMLEGSPEWNALDCVRKIGMTGAEAAPFQDVPTGSFRIEVAEHPQ